jgi:signal transduction histidine kinase
LDPVSAFPASAAPRASGFATALVAALTERPLLTISLYGLVGLSVVLGQTWRHAEQVKAAAVAEAAASYSAAIDVFRSYYGSEIVPRAQRAGVEVTHDYHKNDRALPIPATMSLDLLARIEFDKSLPAARIYSAHPFPWRRTDALDPFEREALAAFDAGRREPFSRFEEVGGRKAFRYATPIVMGEACVACHNSHPDSPKRDWKTGDVRGVQEVVAPLPNTRNLTLRQLFESSVALAMIGGLAILLIGLLLNRLRRSLEESRRLAAVAVQRNEELLAAKLEAERASRAKSEFLANRSHELRTPLNSILGFSEVLKLEQFGPLGAPSYKEYAADIHGSGEHLLSIINDILDMARIEAGKVQLDEGEIDLLDVAAQCMRLVRERASRGGVELSVELPADLPYLRADARAMKQILLNLLSNAVKFTDAGGRVTLSAELTEDGGLAIVVSDTGIGIAPEMQARVLEAFTQADGGRNRRYEGTGLGLPICRGLVALHGGELGLRSAPGEGTLVSVRLPAARLLRRAQAA